MPAPDPRLAAAVRFHQSRDYPAAEAAYRQFLAHQPNHAGGLLAFGVLLHETGRHEDAVDAFRLGIAVDGQPVELRRQMVNPLVALGRLDEAVAEAREGVRLTPASAEAYLTLAQLLGRQGDFAGAGPYARQAADLAPGSAPAWLLLARSLANTGRPTEAVAAFDRAVGLAPGFADAAVERAYLLQGLGRLDEAVAGYEHGLRLAPDNAAALSNAGACCLMLGRAEQAARFFEAAARLSPADPRPRNHVGAALRDAGRVDEALPHLFAAARLDAAYAAPAGNVGSCYAAVGDHARAAEAFARAEALDPAFHAAGSNRLLSMAARDGVTAAELRAAHVAWAGRHADPVGRSPPPIVDRRPDRRLRVGYVSADFREHAVRHFVEPVLAAHDRSAVEAVCYAVGPRRDAASARLSRLADRWHDAAALDAAGLADLVRSHEVDVLVDLGGHTADGRLLTFARRPAPVQVTWLGHPATTGLAAIEYRLTDAVADPPGVDAAYTERLVRLPGPFCVYTDDETKPYDATLPADRNGHLTFGAFNAFSKVTPAMLATWAAILAAVPDSRLRMKALVLANPTTREAVVAAFAAAGVGEGRLDLRPWTSLTDHYALLDSVDLMLDTFPYNGLATTCQAMWMGAPTVTRYGDEFRGRVGLSLMTHLGLPEFAAATDAEYARRAVQLATDLTTLRDLRPTWRDRLRQSPLCDAAGFTRGLEAAYRGVWAAAVAGCR